MVKKKVLTHGQIHLQNALSKIQRRLGGLRYKQLNTILTDALQQQRLTGNAEHHKAWIRVLLVDYYDPMYDFQTARKEDRVIFRGQYDDVLDYLESNYQIT